MANAIYPKYKESLISGSTDISLTGTNVKVSLINTALTPYDVSHTFYSDLDDVTDQGVLSTITIGNTTVVGGLFDGDDVIFPASDLAPRVPVATGNALLIWIDTGDEATSRLVAFLDTSVSGLPVSPNNSNIEIEWNASGIFQL